MTVLKARINGAWVPIAGDSADMRWNTAWGIVGVGSYVQTIPTWLIPANVTTQLTNYLPLATVAGRRYRVRILIRASQVQTGSVTDGFRLRLRDGTNNYVTGDIINFTPVVTGTNTFNTAQGEWLVTGDGTTKQLNVTAAPQLATYIWTDSTACLFYVEDVGPVSTSPPMANPIPVWIPVTAFQNGWTNFTTGNRSPTAYRLRGDMVDLRMAVKGGPSASMVFMLPAGYRPPGIMDFIGRDNAGACMMNINYDGQVLSYGATANNAIVALNCSFSVTA